MLLPGTPKTPENTKRRTQFFLPASICAKIPIFLMSLETLLLNLRNGTLYTFLTNLKLFKIIFSFSFRTFSWLQSFCLHNFIQLWNCSACLEWWRWKMLSNQNSPYQNHVRWIKESKHCLFFHSRKNEKMTLPKTKNSLASKVAKPQKLKCILAQPFAKYR